MIILYLILVGAFIEEVKKKLLSPSLYILMPFILTRPSLNEPLENLLTADMMDSLPSELL